MSLDVRAAALAPGPAAFGDGRRRRSPGLYHTPADAFAGFRTGRTIPGGMEVTGGPCTGRR
jgi:hypothetical protein